MVSSRGESTNYHFKKMKCLIGVYSVDEVLDVEWWQGCPWKC